MAERTRLGRIDRSCLEGIRVIDFGHYLAGPLAGMLLADHGAEVIKVERPGAATRGSNANFVLNRGKKLVILDLKVEADRTDAEGLIRSADIVIENFRPGIMDRLGLGPQVATKMNPGLIYLSLPGFSSSDSVNRHLPAWEGVLGASCGLYTDLSVFRKFLSLPPVYSPLAIASIYGGVHGALAALLALYERGRSGRGETIEVPLVSAAMSAMGCEGLHIPNQPECYDIPPVSKFVQRIAMPWVRRVLALAGPGFQESAYRFAYRLSPALMYSYPCADGRLLYVLAVDHQRHPRDLLVHLGLLDQLARDSPTIRNPYLKGGHRNNLAEASILPRRWQRRAKAMLAETFKKKDAATWEQELNDAGITCAVQRCTKEWLALKPLQEAGIVICDPEGEHGPTRHPGIFQWLANLVDQKTSFPPPEALDRATLKSAATPKPALFDRGAKSQHKETQPGSILAGIRVIDLSGMIAAPVCARTLAEYGAEVIKVESPHPLHGPRMTCWYGTDVNQGKRRILLDLKTGDGRHLFHQLIRSSDVLVHNLSAGASQRLGISRENLESFNPGLIICRVGAYLGPFDGPWDERKGYDPVLQAASGIMLRYGSPSRPEYHGITSCVDYLTGYLAAVSVALALLTRQSISKQQAVEVVTSLAQGAQMAQVQLAYDHKDRIWDEPSGQLCLGDNALHRMYRARDGWLFLAAHPDKREELTALDRLNCPSSLRQANDAQLGEFLERRLRQKTVAYWRQLFEPLDVVAVPIEPLDEIRRRYTKPRPDCEALIDGPSVQVIRQPHPVGMPVDTIAPAYARLLRSPLRYLSPAPKPGANSIEILQELGISELEQRRLVDSGVVSLSLSDEYLPS